MAFQSLVILVVSGSIHRIIAPGASLLVVVADQLG